MPVLVGDGKDEVNFIDAKANGGRGLGSLVRGQLPGLLGIRPLRGPRGLRRRSRLSRGLLSLQGDRRHMPPQERGQKWFCSYLSHIINRAVLQANAQHLVSGAVLERFEKCAQLIRQRRLKLQQLAGCGVREFELCGVKEIAAQPELLRFLLAPCGFGRAACAATWSVSWPAAP